MKKILLSIALLAGTLGAFAQTEKGEKSIVGNIGLKSDPGRFQVGAQGRYVLIDNVRLAADANFVFPKDKTTGFDINLNAHYVFDVYENTTVYPLVGISMQNARFAGKNTIIGKIPSDSYTNWGFNLGAGGSYNLSSNTFVNAELKYTFSDTDCFVFMVGYGVKF